jgi:hypothetical protein
MLDNLSMAQYATFRLPRFENSVADKLGKLAVVGGGFIVGAYLANFINAAIGYASADSLRLIGVWLASWCASYLAINHTLRLLEAKP